MSEQSTEGTCQMSGCARPASGDYTRRMYSAKNDEEWPDDVSERPICRRHWLFEKLLEHGIAGALFGLFFGTAFGVVRFVA